MLTAIYAIIIFCLLIFPHELGHFLAAKKVGVKVNEFALGMGPAIWSKQGKETKYSLRLIPIGGFCAMEGEDEESDDARAFGNQSGWSKFFILVAGSVMNILLAIILMIIVYLAVGTTTTTLDSVQEGRPAYEAGLQAGDTITAIDGKDVSGWSEATNAISKSEGNSLLITVDRNGIEKTFDMTPINEDGRLIIGVVSKVEHKPLVAVKDGVVGTCNMTVMMYKVIKQLITGGVSAKDLTGPVGIVYSVGQASKTGFIYVVYLTALISLNLAIVNMLPFPALDGGRILFLIIRKITGKAVTDDMEAKIHFIGIVLLMGLMVYVTWNDIVRFIMPLFS